MGIPQEAVHESAHTDGERMAHLRTDAAKRAWERENAYNGNMTGASGMDQSEWVNNQKNSGTTIQSGTAKASEVEEFDPYQIRTGKVDPGDTLASITDEVNAFYGTEYTSLDMAKINERSVIVVPQAAETIQVGTIDEDGNVWKPPYEEGVVDLEYWNGLDDEQKDITHYHRRVFEDEDIPKAVDELEKNEKKLWDPQKGDALAHNIGT